MCIYVSGSGAFLDSAGAEGGLQYIYIYIYLFIYLCIYVCVYIYICIYVYMCVYIYSVLHHIVSCWRLV